MTEPCDHKPHVCFYEDMTVNPPRFRAYCQKCHVESGWWPSRQAAEDSLRLATGGADVPRHAGESPAVIFTEKKP